MMQAVSARKYWLHRLLQCDSDLASEIPWAPSSSIHRRSRARWLPAVTFDVSLVRVRRDASRYASRAQQRFGRQLSYLSQPFLKVARCQRAGDRSDFMFVSGPVSAAMVLSAPFNLNDHCLSMPARQARADVELVPIWIHNGHAAQSGQVLVRGLLHSDALPVKLLEPGVDVGYIEMYQPTCRAIACVLSQEERQSVAGHLRKDRKAGFEASRAVVDSDHRPSSGSFKAQPQGPLLRTRHHTA
jgi:hypothetical protein